MSYFAGSGHYFQLNPITDSVLFTAGTVLLITDYNLSGFKGQTFNGTPFDRSTVNRFDRWAMRSYTKSLDSTGDVFMAVALASPLLLAVTDRHEWIPILIMYGEAVMIAQGVKELMKAFIYRPRPYMYFDGYPQKGIDTRDWMNSFPSGHTTMSFLGASFTTFVFWTYFPLSRWRIPLTIGVYGVAAATAVLRMASGNHFFTDVLAGAVLGSLIGVGVPLLHRIGVARRVSTAARRRTSSPELTLLPNGALVTVRF
ncbi:MAG: phosphatase PAP2 family protein [Treponema sp.]|nr:phosphatase PAP2 family protein [Treponema sp.]